MCEGPTCDDIMSGWLVHDRKRSVLHGMCVTQTPILGCAYNYMRPHNCWKLISCLPFICMGRCLCASSNFPSHPPWLIVLLDVVSIISLCHVSLAEQSNKLHITPCFLNIGFSPHTLSVNFCRVWMWSDSQEYPPQVFSLACGGVCLAKVWDPGMTWMGGVPHLHWIETLHE